MYARIDTTNEACPRWKSMKPVLGEELYTLLRLIPFSSIPSSTIVFSVSFIKNFINTIIKFANCFTMAQFKLSFSSQKDSKVFCFSTYGLLSHTITQVLLRTINPWFFYIELRIQTVCFKLQATIFLQRGQWCRQWQHIICIHHTRIQLSTSYYDNIPLDPLLRIKWSIH